MAAAIFSRATLLPAQTFTSGSTGADGAYSPTVSGDFDPAALGINASGDNVFNFTTINIPYNVTIRLRASKVRNAPVVWLATGNVNIAGTLDLSGEAGHYLDPSSAYIASRTPAEPGAGGYYGGLGAKGGVAPEAGAGPGGGPAGIVSSSGYSCYGGSGASFRAGPSSPTYAWVSGTGQAYGGSLAVPLFGGSGGGGGWATSSSTSNLGGGGGAGGGAIRIVSSTQVNISGVIDVRGGNGGNLSDNSCTGGPGAAGTVNVIAPTVAGNGTIYVASGSTSANVCRVPGCAQSSLNPQGLIRIGTSNLTYTGYAPGALVAPLYTAPANSAPPVLRITQINGTSVPAVPGGSPTVPDVQINANTPVTVNVVASNVPVGTAPLLRVTSDTAGDQLVTCNALSGTLASSTTTCTATFPVAVSIAGVRATF